MQTAPAASMTLSSLSSFDWFLAGVIVVSTALAFRRGIIRVLFSIAGVIAGFALASWNYLRLAHWLGRWITSFTAAEIVAFLAILIMVTLIFSIAAGLARRTAKAVGLGLFDRLLGGLFGLLRGLLLGAAVMLAMAAFLPDSAWTKNSMLAPYFLQGSHALSFVVPGRLKEQLASGTTLLLQQTPELSGSQAKTQDH